MPFDTSHEQSSFLSEKARRLLEAHDREVGRNQTNNTVNLEFVRRTPTSFSEVA